MSATTGLWAVIVPNRCSAGLNTVMPADGAPPSVVLKNLICLSVGAPSVTYQATILPPLVAVKMPRVGPIFAW